VSSASLRRAAIWFKTATVIVASVLLIWLAHRLFFTRYIDNVPLSMAVAFTAVQFLVAAIIVTVLFITRRLAEIRARRAAQVTPRIRETLATHAAGQDERPRLAILLRQYPEDFEACLAQFLPLVTGIEYQRLCELTVEIGLVSQWEKRYGAGSTAQRKSAIEHLTHVRHVAALGTLVLALSDHDESIRIRASSALVRSGVVPQVEKVFAFALTQPLLVRALLAEELRPHLPLLCAQAIPAILSSGSRDQILRTLELVQAWRRGLELPFLSTLLRNPDPEIRTKAWQVLPFVEATDDLTENISEAILDGTESVSAAAAAAAGRMRLASAVPALTRQLRGGSDTVVLAAARALSRTGSNGLSVLEAEVMAGTRSSAAAALEALEKARIGRADW
jgi:HEAT repeat protein